jgi:hypothetical protein
MSTALRPGASGTDGAPQKSRTAARVRQPANLATAHRIGLASDRERPHARLADAPGSEVAIQDGVDFVSAGGRLIHTLGVDRHDLFSAHPEIAECSHLVCRKSGRGIGTTPGRSHCRVKAVCVGDIRRIQRASFVKRDKQAIE